jgi:hypothetical protein
MLKLANLTHSLKVEYGAKLKVKKEVNLLD